ncbi:hypothetical protein CAEBREN_18737 [Caenorhabditis brenneri]|uniref:Uncharacterized protein n=1 Tax=Caenorhabditis brenneri TaxID=135651 RepID=G0NNN1_CAEBE|nr:hypothetical protein CAEBREN_18737 [Caenorhabditis brenneri]
METCRGIVLLQFFNIVKEDRTGITEINNVETSPVAPHFSTLPINSKSLLMKNLVAPNLGGSLSQCFSRLTQGVVFAFLAGEGKVEELSCMEIFGNNELDGLNKIKPAVEKYDQEVFRVKDAVSSQKSIFDFLNGDVYQLLIFLVDFDLGSDEMDHYNPNAYEILSEHLSLLDMSSSPDRTACLDNTKLSVQDNDVCSTISDKTQLTENYIKEHDDVEWVKTDAILKDDGFTGEIDENILYSPFHHWHKLIKNDSLSDCPNSENISGLLLNFDAGVFGRTFKFTLENSGFVIGNYHEEDVARTPIPLIFHLFLTPRTSKKPVGTGAVGMWTLRSSISVIIMIFWSCMGSTSRM